MCTRGRNPYPVSAVTVQIKPRHGHQPMIDYPFPLTVPDLSASQEFIFPEQRWSKVYTLFHLYFVWEITGILFKVTSIFHNGCFVFL